MNPALYDLILISLLASAIFWLSWYCDPARRARKMHRDYQRGLDYVRRQLRLARLDDVAQVRRQLHEELDRAWEFGPFERGMLEGLSE